MYQVIVVEDDFRNAMMLEAMIESDDISVVLAQTGEEALNKLSEYDIQLIILDVMLPKMNGVQVTRAIRESSVTSHLPIIAVSANVDNSMIEAIKEAGCNEFLQKPFNIRELKNTVDQYLAHAQ